MSIDNHRQDRELAARAAAGSDAAWRAIYDATCQPLVNFLCYQVGEPETARDLMQETYLAAWNHLERFRGEGSLLSWLRSIALRKSLDWKRRLMGRLKRMGELAREQDETATPPATDARLEVASEAFQQALHRLSERQRACLLLHELEDLPFKEVAQEIGCREATARVHYHRARERMRQMLAQATEAPLAKGMGGQQA